MKIYISGISGTGMGPLALMAKNAGFEVAGSDRAEGAILSELIQNEIDVKIGDQDGDFLKTKINEGCDWFVHTSALPENHPELKLAREYGIKISKRDELTAFLVEKLGLKMVAVAGTHGKTTTTSMIVFASLKLGLPVSYIVGTTLGFAPSGSYHPGDKYFIYEADEYDRNFLKYHPWLAVLPFVSYDHPDIYPTREDYLAAFEQFKSQSQNILENIQPDTRINLAGGARRNDATLALAAIKLMAPEIDEEKIISVLNQFPGVGRRFEQIADGVYSDYAHHPEEIAATIEIAKEEAKIKNKRGVIVVYQPHQNTRQHEVKDGYKTAFLGADKVFWLPTYLTRENPELQILSPSDLIAKMDNAAIAETAEADAVLAEKVKNYQADDFLVILMTAGPADGWLRAIFQ